MDKHRVRRCLDNHGLIIHSGFQVFALSDVTPDGDTISAAPQFNKSHADLRVDQQTVFAPVFCFEPQFFFANCIPRPCSYLFPGKFSLDIENRKLGVFFARIAQ